MTGKINRENADVETRGKFLERTAVLRESMQGDQADRPITEVAQVHNAVLGSCPCHRR